MRGEERVKQSSFVGELAEFLKGWGNRMKQGELQQHMNTLCIAISAHSLPYSRVRWYLRMSSFRLK